MRSTKQVVLFLVFLSACVGTCMSWGEEVLEDAKTKAEEAKDVASEAAHDVEQETKSWVNWAQNKFNE